MTKKSPISIDIRADLTSSFKNLERFACQGIELALKRGATEAQVSFSVDFSKRLVAEANDYTLANSLFSQKIALTVHRGNQKGYASINTADQSSLDKIVDTALELSSFTVPDEALVMADLPHAPPATALAFLFHDNLANMSLAEIKPLVDTTLAFLAKETRIALDKMELSLDVSHHGLLNSYKVRQEECQTILNWFLIGMAKDKEDVSGMDYDGSFSYDGKNLEAKVLATARQFQRKLLSNLHPIKCPSYKGKVILTPRAVDDIFLNFLLYHISGDKVMDGKSRWVNSLGKPVISDLITVLDNPHDVRCSGATSFDGDGLPTKPLTLIEKGTLKTHLHDCYSAKRMNSVSTASAGGPFALEIKSGSTPLIDILNSAPQLVLIDRFSGDPEPVKGDFSGVAKSSRLFKNGIDQGCITETMISGNFFEMINNILAVSEEQEIIVFGQGLAPYILVDGISVTGG